MICKYIFNDLKKQFMIVLILIYFDSDFECIFETDLFDHVQENML